MIRKIVNKMEEKSSIAKSFFHFLRRRVYNFKNYSIMVGAFFRHCGFKDKRYLLIRNYKNKHQGQRCFIVATGPSITMSDLELIKDEVTFSMNSIILAYDKTAFRPTYYGIQDPNVFEKLYPELIKRKDDQKVFIPDGLGNGKEIPSDWIKFKINGIYHMYDYNYTDKYFAKFSGDSYAVVYDGYTITYSLLEIAVYMGFKEIYLLGCDSTYSSDLKKQHFIDYGHYDPSYMKAHDRLMVAYNVAKKYADSHGIKIINATRGGALEIFPRVTLEDVLATPVEDRK